MEEDAIGITPDQIARRFAVTGAADWRLVEVATGETVLAGRSQGFTAYAATSTTVAVLNAAEDARARLMAILADDVAARLAAGLPT